MTTRLSLGFRTSAPVLLTLITALVACGGGKQTLDASYTVEHPESSSCKVKETGSQEVDVRGTGRVNLTFTSGSSSTKLAYFQSNARCTPVGGDVGAGEARTVHGSFDVPSDSSTVNQCSWTATPQAPPCVITIKVRHQ